MASAPRRCCNSLIINDLWREKKVLKSENKSCVFREICHTTVMKDQENLQVMQDLMNEYFVSFAEANGGWEKMNHSEEKVRELLLAWVEREDADSLWDACHYGNLAAHLLWDDEECCFKNNAEDALLYSYDCV
jgi:hypothetical protein